MKNFIVAIENFLKRKILSLLDKSKKSFFESLVTKVMIILGQRTLLEVGMYCAIKKKIKIIDEDIKINDSEITKAIRYSLKNRNSTNNEVIRKLLQWENASEITRRVRKPIRLMQRIRQRNKKSLI